MRRFFDLLKSARQRINARIAVLLVVCAAGSVAVWQGFAHMAATGPAAKGPTKQVATGVQPASATLTDEQMPGGQSQSLYPAAEYTSAPAAPPTNPYQVNPYDQPAPQAAAPAAPEPSPYAGSLNPYADPAAPPAAAPSAEAPANPYRAAVGDSAAPYAPPSPYATAEPPVAAPADASVNPYASVSPPAATLAPIAPQPLRSLGSEPAGLVSPEPGPPGRRRGSRSGPRRPNSRRTPARRAATADDHDRKILAGRNPGWQAGHV